VQLRRLPARASLLAVAAALIAVLVAVPNAGAATFGGGTIKLDFKLLKGVKVSSNGATPKASTGGTFKFAENAGTATMNKQASGSLNIGAASTSITLTKGTKKIVLQSFVEKLTAGKAQLTAKIGGKGKAIAFFDEASTNKLAPNSGFTQLILSSSKMTLTKAGAAALNKAFGLKGSAVLKEKGAVGTASFTAERSLTVVGGDSKTIYDQKFVNDLRACDIELSAVAPATAIPKDPTSAPEGGADLPINAQAGGTFTAKDLIGTVNHLGGTVLTRPAGKPKPAYTSELTNFVFGFNPSGATLNAFIKNINTSAPIGTVTGTVTATLTDGAGTVSLAGGQLVLSDTASGNLSQAAPPLGADCNIPSGSKIGAVSMTAQVN
jgi:hypothetical protein